MAVRGGRVSVWGAQSWEAANHVVNGHTPMHTLAALSEIYGSNRAH